MRATSRGRKSTVSKGLRLILIQNEDRPARNGCVRGGSPAPGTAR